MGTGFIDYLNDYRLTMAERLLRSSDGSVLDIAEQSGFDSLSYFNRIFKRKYGEAPGRWRAGIKHGEIRKQTKTLESSRFKDSGQTGYN